LPLATPPRHVCFLAVPQQSTHRQRQPHQLPPGRHGLPREFVIGNQRQRILAAVAEAVSEVGYAAMTVEDIIKAAGVSRRTFYEHFKSKEEAFLVSYEDISAQLMDAVIAAFNRSDSFVTRVEDCMHAFLSLLAAQPEYANMCIVEVLVAGPTAIERRNAVMRQFTELIEKGAAQELPKPGRPPALTSETLVGGIHEVIYSRVLRGETAELPTLLPDLTFSVLLPYMGRDVATAHYRKLRRRRKK
jgi:AcrR family transcriptional regulator